MDALCIAALLGFLCETAGNLHEVKLRPAFCRSWNNKVAVFARGMDGDQLDLEVGKPGDSITAGLILENTLPARRHTLMHISSVPETSPCVGWQGREGFMQQLRDMPRQAHDNGQIKNLSAEAEGSSGLNRLLRGSGAAVAHSSLSLESLDKVSNSPVSLHWGLALVSFLQLALSAVNNRNEYNAP